MPNKKHAKADAANAKSRASESLKLYIAGCTFRQIAERLDVSLGTAHSDVKKALADAAKERQDLAEGLLEAQVERLQDAMTRITHSNGYQEGEPASINAFIKVCESLRKLLGLDQPAKTDITSGGQSLTFSIVEATPQGTDDKSGE